MTKAVLAVVHFGPSPLPRRARLPQGVSQLLLPGDLSPAELADELARSDCDFVMFPHGQDARLVGAGATLAKRWRDADIAIDDSTLRRSDRRALRAEGLRFLDPSLSCAMVISRDRAVDGLRGEAVAAAGRHWRWALARHIASTGRVAIVTIGRKPILGSRLPLVDGTILDAVISAETGYETDRRILIIGRIEASVSLYFDGLPARTRARLRFVEAEALITDPHALAAADAAIVVRDLERCHDLGLLRLLAVMRIPHLYFADDNPLALASEDRHWRFYTRPRMLGLLKPFHGVIASTPSLVEFFSGMHSNARLFAPVVDEALISTPPYGDRSPCLAITGGAFRKTASARDIMPAILEIAASDPGTVLMAPDDFGLGASGSFELKPMPRIASFRQFVSSWRQAQPNVLLHPRSATSNDGYKTANALLVALYLGAIPIVDAQEPAYAGFGEADGVLKALGADGWVAAIGRARNAETLPALWAALLQTCRKNFASDAQVDILDGLATLNPPLSPQDVAARMSRSAGMRLGNPSIARALRRAARKLASTLNR